ncbi:MAG: hypothetical protein K6L81_15610 [Agarilytica sp.]
MTFQKPLQYFLSFSLICIFSHFTYAGSACTPGKNFSITGEVPHDVNKKSKRLDYSTACNEELAFFAWQQFLALNWQSSYSKQKPIRGVADTSWNYSKPYAQGQPLVWETYAHRSELRPAGTPLNTPFNKHPTYLFVDPPSAGPGNPSFSLFNNLDEDNEIGSCDIYLGPGDPKTQDLVLYQAKVNAAEYDYIKNVFGAEQADPNGKLAKAAVANQKSILKNKRNSSKGINLPAGKYGGNEGAIEIKTAFLRVTAANNAMLKDFFQTEAIYYTADYDKKTKTYTNYQYHNGTFALLGIHIIHKTTAYPDFIFTSFEHAKLSDMDFKYRLLAPLPPTYSDFNPHNAPAAPAGSQTGKRQAVIRQTGSSPTSNGQLYPVPPYMDAVTQNVHKQLGALNKQSVWLNYRLIGVQANITESWGAKPSGKSLQGPNHFMANHVIESDAFLGNFFGPGFGSNPFPSGSNGNGDNIALNGNTYNMGGCKGCHGVAQTSFGTDFSFLLDFGVNKPVVTPDTIIYHPEEP